MIVAQDGPLQDKHTGTANQWDRQIATAGLIPQPVSLRLTTMLKEKAEQEITRDAQWEFVRRQQPSKNCG